MPWPPPVGPLGHPEHGAAWSWSISESVGQRFTDGQILLFVLGFPGRFRKMRHAARCPPPAVFRAASVLAPQGWMARTAFLLGTSWVDDTAPEEPAQHLRSLRFNSLAFPEEQRLEPPDREPSRVLEEPRRCRQRGLKMHTGTDGSRHAPQEGATEVGRREDVVPHHRPAVTTPDDLDETMRVRVEPVPAPVPQVEQQTETEQRPDERQGPGFGKRLERGEEFLHQCDNLLAARRAGIVIGDLNVGGSGLSTHRADVR
jgi:hypothetical protein